METAKWGDILVPIILFETDKNKERERNTARCSFYYIVFEPLQQIEVFESRHPDRNSMLSSIVR